MNRKVTNCRINRKANSIRISQFLRNIHPRIKTNGANYPRFGLFGSFKLRPADTQKMHHAPTFTPPRKRHYQTSEWKIHCVRDLGNTFTVAIPDIHGASSNADYDPDGRCDSLKNEIQAVNMVIARSIRDKFDPTQNVNPHT